MRPYEVLKYPAMGLTQIASAVPEDLFNTPWLTEIAQRMHATIKHRAAKGIGLAGNQVGIMYRIIVVNTLRKGKGYYGVLVNPEILESNDDVESNNEGCLSFPGQEYSVTRPTKVKVKFRNISGQEMVRSFSGLEATCVQHEIDHLNGITIHESGSLVEENSEG